MDTHTDHTLTRYPEGSIRELLTIAWPLALNAMSTYLMLFFDRLILSYYSSDAMNAVGATAVLFTALQFTFLSIAMIAQVFVGQHNGAKRFEAIGNTVWQMIWFGLLSGIVFCAVGIWGTQWLIARTYEGLTVRFLSIVCFGGFLSIINGAITSFFMGIGRTRMVTLAVVIANIANIILDFVLIFGVGDWIPAMGTTGAAFATVAAWLIQGIILFYLFFKKNIRKKYHTTIWHFNKKIFMRALHIGWPSGLVHALEMGAPAVILQSFANVGDPYITTFIIGQNSYFLYCFFTEAIAKGMTGLTSNFIGSKKYDCIHKSLISAVKIEFVLLFFLSLIMVFFPDILVNLFTHNNDTGMDTEHLRILIRDGLFWFWISFVFDGMIWVLYGVIMAATDTRFLLWSISLSCWILYVIPCIVLVKLFHFSPTLMWKMLPIYTIALLIPFFLRYKRKNWAHANI